MVGTDVEGYKGVSEGGILIPVASGNGADTRHFLLSRGTHWRTFEKNGGTTSEHELGIKGRVHHPLVRNWTTSGSVDSASAAEVKEKSGLSTIVVRVSE